MKKSFLLLILAGSAAGSAMAVEFGRVLSATPVMQQVAVPRQVCTDQQVLVQQPNSGGGAVLGAIAGGALGNAAGGHGAGRAAATVIGAVGGAVLGNRIEGTPDAQVRSVRQCGTQTTYENRPVAYNVVYEYAGQQYSVQMPHDPGPKLALQIGPVGATDIQPPPPATTITSETVYVQSQPPVYVPPPVVVTQPVYPVYYPNYYYPPVSLHFGYGYWGGGWGHRHWR